MFRYIPFSFITNIGESAAIGKRGRSLADAHRLRGLHHNGFEGHQAASMRQF